MDSSPSMMTVIEHEVSYNFPDLLDFSENQGSELSSGMIHFSEHQEGLKDSQTDIKWSMSSVLMSSILRSVNAAYKKTRLLMLTRSFDKWQAFQPIPISKRLTRGLKLLISIGGSTRAKALAQGFNNWKLNLNSYQQVLAVRKKALSKKEKYVDRLQELQLQKEHLQSYAVKYQRNEDGNINKKIKDLTLENHELKASVADKKEFLVAYFSELLEKVNSVQKKESKKNIVSKRTSSYRNIKKLKTQT